MARPYLSSQDYRITNPYTLEELEAMKDVYGRVGVSIAFGGSFTEGAMHFGNTGDVDITFMELAGCSYDVNNFVAIGATGGLAQNTWYTFSITIDEYIQTLSGDASYCRFAGIGRNDSAVVGTFYVGAITFVESLV
jgi:hypothetical protein